MPIPSIPPSDSDIEYSAEFEQTGVAKSWGVMPHIWYAVPRWSRAVMIAYDSERNKIDYWMSKDREVQGKN